MSHAYSRYTCLYCQKSVSANGLATTNHLRRHVREGRLIEYQDRGPYGRLRFFNLLDPRDRRSLVRLSLLKEV